MKKMLTLLIFSIIFLTACDGTKSITNDTSEKRETRATSHSNDTANSNESNVIIELRDQTENYDRFLQFSEKVVKGEADNIRIITYTIEGDEIIRELNTDKGEIISRYDTTRDQYGSQQITEETFARIIEKDGLYILKNEQSIDEDNAILTKR